MFCVKCGSEIKDGSLYCSTCGNKVVQEVNPSNGVQSMRPVDTAKAVKTASDTVQISKAVLIRIVVIIIGVVAAGGAVAWFVVTGGNGLFDKFKKEEVRIEDTAPSDIEESPEVVTEDTDLVVDEGAEEVEEAIVYEVREDNEADYLNTQVQSLDAYNYFTSDYPYFNFCYPASLFCSEYICTDDNEGHYGIVKQEVHYSASDGSFVNVMFTEYDSSLSTDAIMSDVYSFEHSFIVEPVELLNEFSAGKGGAIAFRGYTDDNKSTIVFIYNMMKDGALMQMKLYCPVASDDEHKNAIETYIRNMIEGCEFVKIPVADYTNGSTDSSVVMEDEGSVEDDSVGYSEYGWSKAYFDYMETKCASGTDTDYSYAYLIYVNDDNIPELVLEGAFEAIGCDIVTYKNGKIDVLTTSRTDFTYIHKKNLLRNATSNMGYYVDNVYCINNGRWKALQKHEGDENSYIVSKYDGAFNAAYSDGTIGWEHIKKEVFDTTLDYLLFIDE